MEEWKMKKAAFFRFDKDNDGSIDRTELRSMLAATGKTPTDNEVESFFKKGDLDGNGKTTEKVVRVQASQEINTEL